MSLNPHEIADLVRFTEEIVNGKLFLCSVYSAEESEFLQNL